MRPSLWLNRKVNVGQQFWRVVFAKNLQPIDDLTAQRIAEQLWTWAFLPNDGARAEMLEDPSLSTLIEFYMCGLFWGLPAARSGSKGWWCDGIVDLEVEKLARTTFRIAGVAYYPYLLAPFEMDFHFSRRRDLKPICIIFRFGELTFHGSIRVHENYNRRDCILRNRPTRDCDWFIAVEFTNQSN